MTVEEALFWVKLAGKIALYAGAVIVLASLVCSYLITSYKTYSTFELTPADFELAYEKFSVTGARGARLSCWYIPAVNARAVVIVSHGIADSKQGILPYVLKFNQAGYGLILYDMRHHGESTGKHCTLGYFETEDLLRLTTHVRAKYAQETPVLYWGFSLGGTVALLAAARAPDVRAVVAQSPFPSLREVVKYYAWKFYHIPPFPVVTLGIKIMEWRTGARTAAVDVGAAAAKLRGRPVMLIGSRNDRQVPLRWLEQMQRQLGESAELVLGPYGHDDGFITSEELEGEHADIDHAVGFFECVVARSKEEC